MQHSARKHHVWILLAVILAVCLVLAAVMLFTSRETQAPTAPIRPVTLEEEAPGPRRFLNYAGRRYVFLQNGTPYGVDNALLGESLGTLEHQIVIGQPDHLKDNFAATFAVGGTLYEMTVYDPQFRIAVELDGNRYLCEVSGFLDDTPLDPEAYFAAAGFPERLALVNICSHDGSEVLKTRQGKKLEQLVTRLAELTPADLTDDDYLAIADAQQDGRSYLLDFRLDDATPFAMYVIPDLGYASLGDDRYELPEGFAAFFEKLL